MSLTSSPEQAEAAQPSQPRGQPDLGVYPWVAMGVVVIGTFMSILDSTIINVALPQIGLDLHQPENIEWIVTAYLLALAVAQPATGWLADKFGRKRIFVWSMGLFSLGSLAAALAPNLGFLIGFRVLQGLGGGAMMPVGLAMIYELFPPDKRGGAMGIWGIAAMTGPAIGPVLGGFIGSSETTGVTTTLGRGGSDFSASLFGAAMRADAIEVWTDVDGMLTADPRVVAEAKVLEQIAFDEAAELASFGAKVLHPNTIAPAVRLGIPVYVLNSRRPEGKGTKITFEAPKRAVTAIAGKNDVTLIKVGSPRMLLTEGFLRSLFEVFERHRTSVDVVATSEVSVSLTVDDASQIDVIVSDLRRLGDVTLERNRGIVAVVGGAIAQGGHAMSTALEAMGDVRVHMLSLSATGINLTMVVDDDQVKPAMQRLHAAFFGGTS